jgi:predicted kinase
MKNNDQKLIILQGIPASGKSTFAKQFVLESPLTRVRVNRDDIRMMLGKYWVPERENLVSEIEDSCVGSALDEGYTVILDATNLNKKYLMKWEYIAELYNVPIEYKSFYISLEEAIERDKIRENPVGEITITNFYNKYNGRF